MADQVLKDRAILVVEDEYMLAADLRKELVRVGAVVVGTAPTLERALEMIEHTALIDGAILDVSLRGEMVFPAADLLRARGVPFLFATGYDQSLIPPRLADVPRCEKPIGADALRRALEPLVG